MIIATFNLIIGAVLMAYTVNNIMEGHYWLALLGFLIGSANLYFGWAAVGYLGDRLDN